MLVVLVLIAAVGAVGRYAAPPVFHGIERLFLGKADPTPEPMPIPRPGTRTLSKPGMLLLLTDASGSMSRNDPDQRLPVAVRAFGRWLEHYDRSRDRFGLIRFALGATSSQHALLARDVVRGPDALAPRPSDGVETKLGPAVDQAERILNTAPQGAFKSALVLTDGEVADRTEISRLARLVDRLEVVVIDHNDTWDRTNSGWRAPGVRLTKSTNQRVNELGAEMARSFMRMTGEKPE
jgi:hypothetical protein